MLTLINKVGELYWGVKTRHGWQASSRHGVRVRGEGHTEASTDRRRLICNETAQQAGRGEITNNSRYPYI
jgi:hypothetical protein